MATSNPNSGWPDATNTGVPAGVTLTPSGDLVITQAGTVISGLDIKGNVYINAPNVTIENCRITDANWAVVQIKSGVTGTVIQNCEINGVGTVEGSCGISGQGTFIGNNIYNVENGINLTGSSTIEGNYIHDLKAAGSPHYDGIQIDGGVSNVTIHDNTVIAPSGGVSAIMIDNYFGAISNISVDGNLLAGGGFTVYTDAQFNSNPITGVSFTNNHMKSGGYGITNFNKTSPTYTGNVNDGATLLTTLNTTANTGSGGTTPPPAASTPVIASWSSDTGTAGDGVTSDNTIALKGTAAANSSIKIYDGSTQIGTTTASSTGSWDYITSVLSNAKHVLTATATNSSGQTSAASGAVTMTVDTVAPTTPVLSSNSIVNANQVKLSGTAEANSKVTVYDGTTVVGTGTTSSTGAWSITTNALSTGTHALTAKAADVAGNVSAASQSVNSVISEASPAPAPTPTPGTPIESAGLTSLLQSGDKYYLNSNAGGTGLVLKSQGTPFAASSSPWTPIGVEQTATGYQIAWKLAGQDQYTVWNTDKNGNYVSHAIGVVSGASSALASFEANLHQDLNGDGTVGPITKTIELAGSTDLSQTGDNYQLVGSGGGGGLVLKSQGTPFAASSSPWTPIGVEQTATGYQIAWKLTGQDQYTVWNTDKNGNYVSHAIGVVSGASSALASFEANLHQDLNGDGTVGPITKTIESAGSTSLSQAGDNYQLIGSGGGGGLVLKSQGTPFAASSSPWTPIGVEQTATGYQIAWKLTGQDQYTVWNTDKNGNYVSHAIGVVSGASSALASFEANLHQDLNGDGTVGPITKTIESAGSTDLSQTGDNYQLVGSGGGGGLVLKSQGTPFAASSSPWTPIGVEQTATGYQIAWKLAGQDQYTVWNTDKSGNYISHAVGVVSGNSSTLKSFETSFQQDLNGDGAISGSSANAPLSSVALTTMSKNWSDIVTIKGVADANSQIKLYDGNTSLGTVTTAADGTWSFKTSSAVSDAVHTYTAQQIDSTGQVIATSGSAILGSTGSNTLKGTSGNDIFVGSGQGDTFVFAANFGRDVIKDFVSSGSGQDTIQFSKTVFDSFASVLSHASQVGEDVAISTGNDTLTLKNTKLSSLNSNDFQFA